MKRLTRCNPRRPDRRASARSRLAGAARDRRAVGRPTWTAGRCLECGTNFVAKRSGASPYCSDRCFGRVKKRLRRADGLKIHLREVAERDGWVCALCGLPIDPMVQHPDRMAATVDHIWPISRGGTNTMDNAQLAHFSCNSAKGNRA